MEPQATMRPLRFMRGSTASRVGPPTLSFVVMWCGVCLCVSLVVLCGVCDNEEWGDRSKKKAATSPSIHSPKPPEQTTHPVDVDPLGGGLVQRVPHRRGLVVEHVVEAQPAQRLHLVVRARGGWGVGFGVVFGIVVVVVSPTTSQPTQPPNPTNQSTNRPKSRTHAPMTVHPKALQSWPTREPTAPAPPETKTVSPRFGSPISTKGK